MRALIDTGKISTQAHVDQYVQTVSGPLTYLTSKCSEGVVKTAQTLQASPGSAAAFVSAEAKAAKDLSTQSSSSAVPQAAKLAEPKKVEGLQATHLDAKYKRAGEVPIEAAVETEVMYMQTPEGLVFAIENNAGPKHSMSSNAAPKSGGAGSANPKTVVPVQKDVQWTNHGFKHFPSKNLSWKEIVKQTAREGQPAKYKPGINIEALERKAWVEGIPTNNGKTWKVMKCADIIGAKNGEETLYLRIEFTSNTIHGHPITSAEFKSLTGTY